MGNSVATPYTCRGFRALHQKNEVQTAINIKILISTGFDLFVDIKNGVVKGEIYFWANLSDSTL